MKSCYLRIGHIYKIREGEASFDAQYVCPDTSDLVVSFHLLRRVDNGALIKEHQDNIVKEIEPECPIK